MKTKRAILKTISPTGNGFLNHSDFSIRAYTNSLAGSCLTANIPEEDNLTAGEAVAVE